MNQDNDFARSLLRPLAGEPRTASGVDVARAMAEGERRLRTRRWAATGATFAAMTVVLAGGWTLIGKPSHRETLTVGTAPPLPPATAPTPAGPVPPSACVVKRLPMPAGHPPKSVVTGGDPTGRFIVGRSYPGTQSTPRLLIWEDGQAPQAVAMPGGDQQFTDINSRGVAVGTSFVGSADRLTAWVYRDGKLSKLSKHPAAATGINEEGMIVGAVNERPALWASPTSQPTMLELPAGDWAGTAIGIDEDGTIVGAIEASDRTGDMRAVVWNPDGRLRELPAPMIDGQPANTYTAKSIAHGWVSGWAGLDSGSMRLLAAPRWNLRTGQVDTSRILSQAINRHGWQVGTTGRDQPVLLTESGVLELPTLDGSQELGNMAVSLSDDGRTIAGYLSPTGKLDATPVAVVWRCN